MTNNSDNIYSVIELKKSLKRSIIQLEKAMDILNQNSPDELPNLTVVENIVKSSNALVDYLKLKNSSEGEGVTLEENQEQKRRVKKEKPSEKVATKNIKVEQKKESSFLNISQNLWLIIILVISISFNILNLVNNPLLPQKNITIASNEEIVIEKPEKEEEKSIEKSIEESEKIEIGDNIFLNDNIDINNNQEKPKLLEEKPYTIGENIFQEETPSSSDDLTEESNPIQESIDNLKDSILLPNNSDKSEDKNQDTIQDTIPNSSDLALMEDSETAIKSDDEINTEKEKENDNNAENELVSLLELTPEQFIIKNIENQITNITKKYGENLIVKVKANFSENSIILTLSEKWYNLNNNQQNNFANDVFNQVKSVDFYKFKLENTEGELLARNAVVGDRLIIMQ